MRISVSKLGLLFLAIGGACSVVEAQPSFEVASVKQHDPKDTVYASPACAGNRFVSRGGPITLVVMWAYDLRLDQVRTLDASLPMWARITAYDMQAVAEGSLNERQCKQLVKGLLGDRFKMTFHWKTLKNTPANELSVGPKGHKLVLVTDSDQGCSVHISPQGRERPCETYVLPEIKRGITMPDLAQVLTTYSVDPVYDNTGLVGEFKIKLTFAAVQGDPNYPSLQTALREQLGLVMRTTSRDIEVMIVDRIERPTPN